MNQNQMNTMGNNGYPMPPQNSGFKLELPVENRIFYIGVIASIVLVILGCFLPLYKVAGQSIKYIANSGKIADGIFLVILGVFGLLSLLWKKNPIAPLVLQIISTFLFINQWLKIKDIFKSYNSYAAILGNQYKATYGIGFWIILLGLIGSIVCCILLIIKGKGNKANAAPVAQNNMQTMQQPMNQMPINQPAQPQMPVNNNCPYCGTPKASGSAFCQNCGAKM